MIRPCHHRQQRGVGFLLNELDEELTELPQMRHDDIGLAEIKIRRRHVAEVCFHLCLKSRAQLTCDASAQFIQRHLHLAHVVRRGVHEAQCIVVQLADRGLLVTGPALVARALRVGVGHEQQRVEVFLRAHDADKFLDHLRVIQTLRRRGAIHQ